jgi:hypothetical protein
MRTRKASCALERPVSLEERGGEEGGGGSTASLAKKRREKGEGLGALARSRLEKMGLAPDRRGFVGAGREVIDTSLGAMELGGGGTSTEIGEKGGPVMGACGPAVMSPAHINNGIL